MERLRRVGGIGGGENFRDLLAPVVDRFVNLESPPRRSYAGHEAIAAPLKDEGPEFDEAMARLLKPVVESIVRGEVPYVVENGKKYYVIK